MKRKQKAAILGTVIMTAALGGTAQARTHSYAWEGEHGACWYQETDLHCGWQSESLEEERTASDAPRADVWCSATMQDFLCGLEKYGVTYDEEQDVIWYKGKKVRYLIDNQENQCTRAFMMEGGVIDLYTVRDEKFCLTGVHQATQEEFDAKTDAEFIESGSPEATAVDDDPAKAGISLELRGAGAVSDASDFEQSDITETDSGMSIAGENGSRFVWFGAGNSGEISRDEDIQIRIDETGEIAEVIVGAAGTESGRELPQDQAAEEKVTAEAAGASEEETIAAEATGTSEYDALTRAQLEEARKQEKEYAEFGITSDPERGGWFWNGKPVHILFDEAGGFTVNSSSRSREGNIYLLVKRNADGAITEVKQVTVEEAMQQIILREENKELETEE